MGRSESHIWEAVGAAVQPALLGGMLHRIVESQEQVATRTLVDGDLGDQDMLEAAIESSKPTRPPGTGRFDYLLASPWRYPPLRYGSRFGTRQERSLFYGAGSEMTALAEAAYYRLLFRHDMHVAPPLIESQHTMFEARYRTELGLRLQATPFDRWKTTLTHPSDYGPTQRLGAALRTAGVEAFEFTSARDPLSGYNIALIAPSTLISNRHLHPSGWFCSTSECNVTFSRKSSPGEMVQFPVTNFLVDGDLPRPA